MSDDRGGENPYRKRSTALTTTRPVKLLPRPTGRAFGVRVIGWGGAALSMILAMPNLTGGFLLYSVLGVASATEFVISKRWYWRARRVIESLPFEVHHEPGNDRIPKRSGRAIMSMAVVFDAGMTDLEVERVVRAAQQIHPALTATDDTVTRPTPVRVINFYGWPNEDADIVVLANLLDTWGRQVHELHVTRAIVVRWRTYTTD